MNSLGAYCAMLISTIAIHVYATAVYAHTSLRSLPILTDTVDREGLASWPQKRTAFLSYQEAVEAGNWFIALLSSDQPCVSQSAYANPADVGKYGWITSEKRIGFLDISAPARALTSLGLPLGDPHNIQVTLEHLREVTINGKTFPPTHALYVNTFNLAGAIIARDNESPTVAGSKQNPPVKGADIIPLRQWSDVAYLQWARLQNGDEARIRGLRAVLRLSVINPTTRRIIEKAVLVASNQQKAYPGMEFDKNSEQAQAIIATPNGQGVAWMLLQHKDALGTMEIASVRVWYRLPRIDRPDIMFNIKPVVNEGERQRYDARL